MAYDSNIMHLREKCQQNGKPVIFVGKVKNKKTLESNVNTD